jgi:hypothetical protein
MLMEIVRRAVQGGISHTEFNALPLLAGDGRVFVTAGIAAMSPEQQVEIMRCVHGFVAFTSDNDLSASTTSAASSTATLFWKIDCYDRDLNYDSPDSSDEN